MPNTCKKIFEVLLSHFGPQHWWPAETPFEVMVGAILTQNTNWSNVERAISNLRQARMLTPRAIDRASRAELASLIRPAGYYNIKAGRLKNLVRWLCAEFAGRPERMRNMDTAVLRERLLSVKGVGPETADSILLYATGKTVFVVDSYTYRVFTRHGLIPAESAYEDVQAYFESNLPDDAALFGEYHALIVKTAKEFCRKDPRCEGCPLLQFGAPALNGLLFS
ncbi:MAG: endonuclease III domain-containing protein [Planctomycetota bacterium]|nr:endonuclease III domain-containing protein [Planctomycetota bacterium]